MFKFVASAYTCYPNCLPSAQRRSLPQHSAFAAMTGNIIARAAQATIASCNHSIVQVHEKDAQKSMRYLELPPLLPCSFADSMSSAKEPNLRASSDMRSSAKPSGHKSSKVRASRDSHQSSRSSGGKSSGIRSSRTGAHSGSKKAYGSEASGSARMIVRDDDGNDVTPLSLLASSESKSK